MTDVIPEKGTLEDQMLTNFRGKGALTGLPYDFRLKRAMRIIPIDDNSIKRSLDAFNDVVRRIEICRGKENATSDIFSSWESNPTDKSTCTACDAKTYCPDSPEKGKPKLPGVRVK